ncbi:MAG TPA: magnesium transporter CorA family protein [Magnetospirillaceae bacterium]|nr:magnesium transporter CorA family protein [Magnetospirillaceae bacterium]
MRHFEITAAGLSESADGRGNIMIASAPDEQAQALLKEWFRLDDYDVGSMLDPDEIPRLEGSGGRMYLIWKSPESATVSGTIELGINTLGICLDRERLAFVRTSGGVSFSDREFRGIRNPQDVMLAVFQRTIRHFVAHLKFIRQLGLELEKKISVSLENKHLLQMFSLSEDLVYYQDAIEGNAAVLSKLRGVAENFGFEARQRELLDDVILENAQAARQATIFASVLSGLMDARGNLVNNNMNVLLKNLTLINIVFLPLNLIASIGGMSEFTMMTEGSDWRFAYFLFSITLVLIGCGIWVFMKKVIGRGVTNSRDGNQQWLASRYPYLRTRESGGPAGQAPSGPAAGRAG